jgi:hypothetical protein
MFYSADCPFKSERMLTVKISCKHPTFSIAINMDELFHKPWISNVTTPKKTHIHGISSSAKTVHRNLRGTYIIAINDTAIFSKASIIDAFDTVQKSKDKSFKLIIGCLDKISAQEAQREQDDLLLHTEKSASPQSQMRSLSTMTMARSLSVMTMSHPLALLLHLLPMSATSPSQPLGSVEAFTFRQRRKQLRILLCKAS